MLLSLVLNLWVKWVRVFRVVPARWRPLNADSRFKELTGNAKIDVLFDIFSRRVRSGKEYFRVFRG